MLDLESAIKHCEEVAEKYCEKVEEGLTADDFCDSCASEHRQLAEWLRELKESRIALDILGQFLADIGIDVCCGDLVMTDNYCEKYCENLKPYCWYRWAKMKAKEVNADDDT